MAAVTRLLDDPRNGWWDDLDTDDVVEDRDDILRRALLDARDEMTPGRRWTPTSGAGASCTGSTCASRRSATRASARSSGSSTAAAGRSAGGTAAVDASSWDASAEDRPYVVTQRPSMRMVVSLADLDDSRWINLTGVSGHPFHEHYTDQTDLWARGETLPWPFTRGRRRRRRRAHADAGADAGR